MSKSTAVINTLILAIALNAGVEAGERRTSVRLVDSNTLHEVQRLREAEQVKPPKLSRITEELVTGAMTPNPLAVPTPIEKNVGQGADEALFVLRGPRHAAALLPGGLAIAVFDQPLHPEAKGARRPITNVTGRPSNRVILPEVLRRPGTMVPRRGATIRGHRISLGFKNAGNRRPVAEMPLKTRVRQFTGNKPSRWFKTIPAFGRVRYPDLYRDIDLMVSAPAGRLSYAFLLGREGKIEQIEIVVDGVEKLAIDASGALVMQTLGGPLVQSPPQFAQEVDGKRMGLKGRYVLKSRNSYGFVLEDQRGDGRLVIDPSVVMTTYFGGSGNEGMLGTDAGARDFINRGFDVAIGPDGHAYVVGMTASPDFPVTGSAEINGTSDVFVTRIDPTATCDPSRVCYSVFIGGSSSERGRGIAVLPDGRAFITGHSSSADFPTSSDAVHPTRSGAGAYVARLSPDGVFERGTHLGSGAEHHPNALVHVGDDGDPGSIIVAGSARPASSGSDVTDSVFQDTHGGGTFDGFIARIELDLDAYRYFTFLGGSGRDVIMDVAQRNGQAYVVGTTTSFDFPVTVFALQTEHASAGTAVNCSGSAGEAACADLFVTRFGPDGEIVAFSTFIGDERENYARGIAVSADGRPVITGASRVPGEADTTEIFIKRLESGGGGLLQDVALPGVGADHGEEVVIDAADRAHVTGTISRQGLTTGQGAEQYHGGDSDIFYTRLPAQAGNVDYLTYLGGSGEDRGFAVAAQGDPNGNFCAMIAGATRSTDLAVLNEIQAELASAHADLLLTLVCDLQPDGDVVGDGDFYKIASPNTVRQGETVTFTIHVFNGSDFDVPARLTDSVPPGLTVSNVFGPGCNRIDNNVTCGCDPNDDAPCIGQFALQPGPNHVTIQATGSTCGRSWSNSAELTIGDFQLTTAPVDVFVACPPPPLPDPFCGDGATNGNEACDWTDSGFSGSCRFDCTIPVCGDGVIDTVIDEQCDGGANCSEECQRIEEEGFLNCTASELCAGDLVCGKGCYVAPPECLGFVDANGVCLGIQIFDDEPLCDVDFRCMPASQASWTIEDVQ